MLNNARFKRFIVSAFLFTVFFANAKAACSFDRHPTGSDTLKLTAPQFSTDGGFFPHALDISLFTPVPGAEIRYTLDGSEPTEKSTLYRHPIPVKSRAGEPNTLSEIPTTTNLYSWLPPWRPPLGEVFKATVIRARVFAAGLSPGPTVTNTYFIDPAIHTRYGDLPVVSVVTDFDYLFGHQNGMYVPGANFEKTGKGNYFLDLSAPMSIEYFQAGGLPGFKGVYKVSLNGSSSIDSPQKGLSVNANGKYGDDKIDFPLFRGTDFPADTIRTFHRFILRAWGSDRQFALFRDAYAQRLLAGKDIDVQAYRPCVVFINGEYWGLQEIRESIKNKQYYEEHYGIDGKSPGVDIIEKRRADRSGNYPYQVEEGDSLQWVKLVQFFQRNEVDDSLNYGLARSMIDIPNYQLNMIHAAYLFKADWPGQNEAVWRPRTATGKWRWIVWDVDNSLGFLGEHYTGGDKLAALFGTDSHGNGPQQFFPKLVKNPQFRTEFINRFCDQMNTDFAPEWMEARLFEMVRELEPHLPEYKARWQANADWDVHLEAIRSFIRARPRFVKEQLRGYFELDGQARLSVQVSDTSQGTIQVHSLCLNDKTPRTTASLFPWTGEYFVGVPVPIKAIPKPGFRFVKWKETGLSNPELMVTLGRDSTFTAVFQPDFEPEKTDDMAIRLFPNPAGSEVEFTLDSPRAENGEILLWDSGGKMLKTVFSGPWKSGRSRFRIRLDGLPSGWYLVGVAAGSRRVVKKLLIR